MKSPVTSFQTARPVPATDETPWVVLDKNAPPSVIRVLCTRCKKHEDIKLPAPMRDVPKRIEEVTAEHKNCK